MNRDPFYSASLLTIGFLLFTITAPATASWRKIFQLDTGSVGCIFFFNANIGFLGCGDPNFSTHTRPSILRTSDGGSTWDSTAPPGVIYEGGVTDIYFSDSLHGWASVYNGSYGWSTVNGGVTWKVDSSVPLNGSSIYASVDAKKHFNTYPFGSQCAFLDSMNGVLTGIERVGCKRSTDGGVSWTKVFVPGNLDDQEMWGVYACKQYQMYFAAPEGEGNESMPLVSTDSGASWQWTASWPLDSFGVWKPTGAVSGSGPAVYVQSNCVASGFGPSGIKFKAPRGLCRTTDAGATWKHVGGPSNYADTRFWATGCHGETVIAFDGSGGVWRTDDGGDGALLPPVPVNLLNVESVMLAPDFCGEAHAVIHIRNEQCNPMRIDSIALLNASQYPNGVFVIDTMPDLPCMFSKSDLDSIDVCYHPYPIIQHDTSLSADLMVRYYSYARKQEYDTIIHFEMHSLGPVRQKMILEGYDTAITPGTTERVTVRLVGQAPYQTVTNVHLCLEFDQTMFVVRDVRALQGILQSVATKPGSAEMSIALSRMPDTSQPFASVELEAMMTKYDSTSIRIIANDVTIAGSIAEPCLVQMDTAGTAAYITMCGGQAARDIHFAGSTTMRVYPNPTAGWLALETRGIERGQMIFTDLLGRTIYKNDFSAERSRAWIDATAWQQGVYSVVVKWDGGMLRQTVNVIR